MNLSHTSHSSCIHWISNTCLGTGRNWTRSTNLSHSIMRQRKHKHHRIEISVNQILEKCCRPDNSWKGVNNCQFHYKKDLPVTRPYNLATENVNWSIRIITVDWNTQEASSLLLVWRVIHKQAKTTAWPLNLVQPEIHTQEDIRNGPLIKGYPFQIKSGDLHYMLQH